MNLQVSKDQLLEAFERLAPISSRGLKSDYKMAGKMTMVAEGKNLVLKTSNGHLGAEYSIPVVECKEGGTATVNMVIGQNAVTALGSSGAVIEINKKDDGLHLTDKTIGKHKRHVKLEVFGEDHDFKIATPKSGLKHKFDSNALISAWSLVAKYKSDRQYKIKYLMTCFHFLPSSTRFVCGDGMRFAVLEQKSPCQVTGDGEKFLVPVDQSLLMSNALVNSSSTTVCFKSAQECYIEAEDQDKKTYLRLLLVGIPKEEYIAYETHAYRSNDAVAIIDVPTAVFKDMTTITGSVRNKKEEKEGSKYHTIVLNASPNGWELHVDEGNNRADADGECAYYDIDKDAFNSAYCWSFFEDVALASSYGFVRMYCIDEQGILIVEPCDIDENNKDERGIPQRKESPDGSRLIFFFAAATEEE